MTSGTPSRSRRASDTPMLCTTWLAETTLPSEWASESRDTDANGLRNFSLEDVHVEGAERIAEAVAKYDVDRFIHVSSYNADPNSTSEFFSTKVRYLEACRGVSNSTTGPCR